MNPKRRQGKKQHLARIYGLSCWWCEIHLPLKKLTLDHLVPRSKGGSNSLENLRLSCLECNRSRGDSLYPPKKSKAISN
ncbi:MAG: HNH endonuclease [Thainema sp.]